jgi:hypothetical protein
VVEIMMKIKNADVSLENSSPSTPLHGPLLREIPVIIRLKGIPTEVRDEKEVR